MIVITAASGKLGQAVAARLLALGVADRTRLTARDPGKLEAQRAQGFSSARADYDDPASLDAAFAGAETLLLISGDDPTDDRIRQHRAAIDAATGAGVRRIVYTSFANAVPESLFSWTRAHVDTEAYLRDAPVSWTVLRNNQYFGNLDPMLDRARETGVFALPGAGGKVAYVGHDDIAAAAAQVLLGEGHAGQTYELTGSEAFDGPAIAAAIGETLRREIAAVDAPPEEFAAYFRSIGLPDFVIEGLLTCYAASAAGEYAAVSDDIERLTGTPARSLRDHIRHRLG